MPLPDESGSDSDGAESTSSSYSSLSDFVIDIQNSDINGDTPGKISLKYAHDAFACMAVLATKISCLKSLDA